MLATSSGCKGGLNEGRNRENIPRRERSKLQAEGRILYGNPLGAFCATLNVFDVLVDSAHEVINVLLCLDPVRPEARCELVDLILHLLLVVTAEAREASIGGVVPTGRSQKIAHPASAHVTQDVDREHPVGGSRVASPKQHITPRLSEDVRNAHDVAADARAERAVAHRLQGVECGLVQKWFVFEVVGNEVAVVQLTRCWIGIAEYEILVHHQLVAGVRVGLRCFRRSRRRIPVAARSRTHRCLRRGRPPARARRPSFRPTSSSSAPEKHKLPRTRAQNGIAYMRVYPNSATNGAPFVADPLPAK